MASLPMRSSLFLLAVLIACLHFSPSSRIFALQTSRNHADERMVLDDQLIEMINAQGLWKAGRNPRFEGVTVAQAKKMMGVQKRPIPANYQSKLNKKGARDLPVAFDSRSNWPGCIHPVLDQGDCGSCWAFGATETLSDRFCIESKGQINVVLSPQSLVSCDWEGNFGCGGGIPQLAWEYMEFAGVLTLDCFPYSSGGNGTTPDCPSSCATNGDSYTLYYAEEFAQESYWTEYEIQVAIMTDGPVEGTMDVYSDFMNYQSGVYVTSANATYLGGHAIKIVGWDHDTPSDLDYWIVQNSWGTSWGIDGFFYIQRGVDMCGIDHDATAGYAYLKNRK